MSTRIRERAWIDFVQWCRRHGLRPLPAHPWTVAAYARWCEPRHKYPNIVNRIRAIARAHLLRCRAAPDRHPTVTRTLRMIELRARGRADRASLFQADDPARRSPVRAARAQKKVAAGRRRPSLKSAPRLVSRRPSPA
jgi:hypothetical protein